MNLLLLIRKNLLRDRLRTALTIISIAGAVLLLAALLTVYNALQGALDSPAARQIMALRDRHVRDGGALPTAYGEVLRRTDGVDAVLPWSYVFVEVNVTSPSMGIATDPATLPRLMPPIVQGIPELQYRDFQENRTAVLAGRELVNRFKWKVGDTVTLIGGSVSRDFSVRIAGIVDFPLLADNFIMHDAYYQALREQGDGANLFFFHVANADRVAEVRRAIAARLEGRPTEVEVISVSQYVSSLVSQAGEASTFVLGLVIVVSLATMLVVGNTMAMAARERAHDVAILRSLGFNRLHILRLVLGEAVWVAVAGSLIGGIGAYSAFHMVGFSLPLGPQSYFSVGAATVLESLAVGVAMGLVAGLPSALRSTRLDVVSVMRGVH